ncbi:DUF3108 domain-containing protein [Paraburkholderia sp. Ac-20340]|uniref:DUF3108 domain-containing protein n=1 Tax=Paraburkholderia sp. Ac-20340 TaxID=2703888 RepID=UPI00197D3B40|nr:DUF3108 domain-containing protein [Paraburkholderia sp. Ac-20340]MBN3855421.1 DUF3108 domain-containing protein [Paraburkholderia sp. Ac-20340]
MSTPTADRNASTTPRRPRAWRWLAVFVAVTLLHWLAAEWFERHHGPQQPVAPKHVPVQIRLLTPERIEQQAKPAAPAAKPAEKPAAPARPKRAPSPPHTLEAITPPVAHPKVAAAPEEAASAPEASDAAASASARASGASQAAAPGNGNTPAAPAAQVSHGVKFQVPPSGELKYDTFFNGARNEPGTIHWKSDGQHYEMVVSIPLPFVGTFSWTSRGHVDAFGLAPDQYIEKRGRRPADFTVFNRNDKQIVFTRTPNSLALPDGAQDRFSMVMQLASLVRGDPDTYKPGVTREFYVADNDSGETWPITTIGDETVRTDQGFVSARHFMRLPRHDGDKRRIDVWLAPSLGWLPVRLVQTEPNGTEVELLWHGALSVPKVSGASDDASNDMTNQPASAPTAASASVSVPAPTAEPSAAQPAPESVPETAPEPLPAPPADAPMHP